eukprot:CAMPEP_0198730322 /NCGR_PEP_ID=MMETSP1475-20131203/24033_1 /TAXON_ID= ORGANISM="Unidentified sp., Strain CCMP1999" /NCGR_SAMPLE_ID=MMETSP1475 /ASSEMBLY_ACC=CAM_ASM_001111 /LENGTH=136 /DNA_ID=CAMNT_0044493113 /DNA_START=134 /DNA_END=544 /DNA_ORIENTATION=+
MATASVGDYGLFTAKVGGMEEAVKMMEQDVLQSDLWFNPAAAMETMLEGGTHGEEAKVVEVALDRDDDMISVSAESSETRGEAFLDLQVEESQPGLFGPISDDVGVSELDWSLSNVDWDYEDDSVSCSGQTSEQCR